MAAGGGPQRVRIHARIVGTLSDETIHLVVVDDNHLGQDRHRGGTRMVIPRELVPEDLQAVNESIWLGYGELGTLMLFRYPDDPLPERRLPEDSTDLERGSVAPAVSRPWWRMW